MKTIDYLDAIRARYECSDYKAAQLLGISRSGVSTYRRGISAFDDDVAVRVAELLEMDSGIVLADVSAERAERQHKMKAMEAWKRARAQLANLSRHVVLPVIAALVLLGALAAPVKSYAQHALHSSAVAAVQEYILCQLFGYWLAGLARLLRGARQPISAAWAM